MKVRRPHSARSISVKPLTPARWPDLERLFGSRGACAGCWCMAYRLTRSRFERRKGLPNKRAFRSIVDAGPPPGLIAYIGREPAGWCALAPRDAYPVLDRSRVSRRVDDVSAWAVTCFFVAKPFRRTGLSGELLRAAIAYAARHGAPALEGYPVEPAKDWPGTFAWPGLAVVFRAAGFTEILRRTPARPIMRLTFTDPSRSR